MAENIEIPLPEDIKWEAFGRGYASVLMEEQARIDRLERLIWMLYENIVKGVSSTVLDDDDVETSLCRQILDKAKELNDNLTEASHKFATLSSALSNAEDTIMKLKRKDK